MKSHPESSLHSRKRMRLSSPTFDEQVGDLSQEDINAFDFLDAKLSRVPDYARQLSGLGPSKSPRVLAQSQSVDDEENPFYETRGVQIAHTPDASGSGPIYASFMRASAVNETEDASLASGALDDSNLPDGTPPEVDYTAWFNSGSANTLVGFQTATTAKQDALLGFQRPSISGAKPKAFLIPSAAALREAEEKMKMWQGDEHPSILQPTPKEPASSLGTQPLLSLRPAFSTATKVFSPIQVPETPTPAPNVRSANVEPPPTSIRSSFQSLGGKMQLKPFKPPLIAAAPLRPVATRNFNSPLPVHQSFTSASSQVPSIPSPVAPLRTSSVANQVMSQKPLGFTPRHGSTTRPKFVTPFKAGLKGPSTLGITKTTPNPFRQDVVSNRTYPPPVSQLPHPSKLKDKRSGKIFDITPPPGRQTLATSGLYPQAHSAEELEDMGINFKELDQINTRTALLYTFSSRSRAPTELSESSLPLGHTAALEELHSKGCSLATKAWIESHWPLVLWKLAGMVALDPTSEKNPVTRRWCWPEVIRQLMYRYERDLNGSSRPPLRLITTRDASAESPMVLCVSDIIWSNGGCDGDDIPSPLHPELEVTDGWYRLRARIDAPLARAVKKGKIRIGRKIAVAGTKLFSERKEGSEILEAYDSNVLLLTGNSSHMAPWHGKLGFQRGPFIATLNSLTADGGTVAVMMFEVIKAFPVAYIELTKEANGPRGRQGPHDAKEESKLSTQWKAKRESHASKLWSEYEKRQSMMADYAERLQQRAGSKFNAEHEDGPPDKIYDMYDAMQEDPAAAKSIISSISCQDATWLARHILDKAVERRESVSREIEQELESICPPRNVRAFCVLRVKDAHTQKHPSNRRAQVTVWDIPALSVTEGWTSAPFASEQHFLVTNLVPTQSSAWMDRSSGSEVYLSTRKNTKWTRTR
ncbi:hypothetical protein PAXRUDRAFT_831248 [Paxillus rubicundulus Ve08.2h10]|uniref:BRCA2 OB1 domain-containing protein n=1 Tax=Paxillus rubicundulus Ve08.2h10 TaxID=930991 RepID=A0A0D0DIV5_9AGAM|nr:hypothetical protein PAXRUDRAFT_831248 [Paxillus rubicundulus Ve08.2h10]